jgi:hypothetical protein
MRAAPAKLKDLAGDLRSLVAEGRYLEARGVLEEYGCVLEQRLRGLAPGDPPPAELMDDWRRLMDAARVQILAGRAHVAARLARLPRWDGPYRPAGSPRRTWELIG